MKRFCLLSALILLVALFPFCSSPKKIAAITAAQTVTFEGQVMPLLKAKCTPCHIPPLGTKKHYGTYDVVKEDIDEMIRRVQLQPGENPIMPHRKSEALPDSLVQVFVKWKAGGLLEK